MGRWGLAAVAALAVAGCGGGGGSGGSSVPVVAGSTPAPTPSPTATATPGPTYSTYAQLAGNQTFQSACASLNLSGGSPPPPNPATGFGDGLLLNYTAASDSYAITNDGLNLSFGPADVDPAAPVGVRSYVRTEPSGFRQRFTIGTPAPGGVGADYVRGLFLTTQRFGATLQYQCVFGVPTLLTDRPTESSVSFARFNVGGSAYVTPASGAQQVYSLANSVVTLNVNLTTGEVRTTLRLIGNLAGPGGLSPTTTELGTFTGTAGFDATRQSYYGQLTSTDRQSQFSYFGGWFFGPQGREAGFAMEILAADPATNARMSVLVNVTAAR